MLYFFRGFFRLFFLFFILYDFILDFGFWGLNFIFKLIKATLFLSNFICFQVILV